ncbi:MAG: hypothetical protein PHI87_04210 [Candidatus Methanomethylophilus sp.]|nr:hypothetical protein [Methanomethylophilus sp.]
MRDCRIACVPLPCTAGDIAGNLRRLEAAVMAAADRDSDLVLLPEACLTGYATDMDLPAVTLDGPEVRQVCRIGQDCGVTVAAGTAEKADGGVYLTQFLAEDGAVIGSYRKTHLGEREQKVFRAGGRLNVIGSKFGKIGFQLCWEAHFPEITRCLALQGADLVLIPTASGLAPARRAEVWNRILPARADDNTVFVAAVNQCGDNGRGLVLGGGATVFDPRGGLLAADYRGQAVVADLKAARLAELRQHGYASMKNVYYLPRRRPELYGPLVAAKKDGGTPGPVCQR